jgi:acetolactate synthase-1/2/3 large subunit
MQFLYGYSVAAKLVPETPYEGVVRELGGDGTMVRDPARLNEALTSALVKPAVALVNVLTDPTVAYPRRSNLA